MNYTAICPRCRRSWKRFETCDDCITGIASDMREAFSQPQCIPTAPRLSMAPRRKAKLPRLEDEELNKYPQE